MVGSVTFPGLLWFPLIHRTSNTRYQGCADMQSLVECLDHSDVYICVIDY